MSNFVVNPYRFVAKGCFFTSDFTEDNWDDLGNQDANGGDNNSSTSITSEKLRITSNSASGCCPGGAVAIREMSEALGSSWNIRFNYTTGGSMTKTEIIICILGLHQILVTRHHRAHKIKAEMLAFLGGIWMMMF